MRNYPAVPVKNVIDTYFGIPLDDPYRYLENATDSETLAIVAAENDYTRHFFEAHPEVSVTEREKQLRAREKTGQLSGIQEACGLRCAMRAMPGSIHDVVALDENFQVERVILNEEMMGNRLHLYSVDPNPTRPGIYAVMGVLHGHPRCCVVVWDDVNRREIAILDGTFGFEWAPDGASIVYSDAEVDAAHNRNINFVRRWQLDTGATEVLYTHEENAAFIYSHPLPGGACLCEVLCTYDDLMVLYIAPDGSVTRLTDGKCNYGFIGEKDGLYAFKTNAGAPMSRLIAIRADQLTQEGALLKDATVLVEECDAILAAAGFVPEGVLALYERDAASELALLDMNGCKLRDIPLPDRYGTASFEAAIRTSDAGRIFYGFESFTMKPSQFVMDAKTLASNLVQGEAEDVSDITVEQCFLPARDGQRILAYLVRPRDLQPNGHTPVLMYGYGGYAASSNPWPEDMVTGHNVVEWVRQGRIYVHCILRGGMEYGTAWHEAAMGLSKKNAFYDFIDIAQYLVDQGWTKPGQIVATGLSNGGLLMTAITTMRPDLFGVVIASVPHTDMIRFRNDDRGMMYITEYGDPTGSEEMFRYMLS